jgi:peptide/nickel transport system substrate-binding protein
MEDDIVTVDPHLHDDSVTHSVLSNIFDPLVAFDGQMRITPALAVTWENPDDLTWRFRLRPGVRFHSGAPCLAGDVVYSLSRAKNTEIGHYISQVSKATEIDSLTVELTTDKPVPVLLNKLTFVAIVPRGCQKPMTRPEGTGPYVFLDYRKGEFLSLKAKEGYWGGRPAILKATFKVIPEDRERLQALTTGEILLARDMEGESRERILAHPGLNYLSRPGLGVSHLGVNLGAGGPLSSRRVRQAIFWALDPAEIVSMSGMEAEPWNQLVSPYIVGYHAGEEVKRPDLERAKKLLNEAGRGRGFDLKLELSTSAALSSGPVIARQLGRIGVRVEVAGMEWTGFTQRLKRRESQFYLIGWACSSGDASDLYDACLHTRTETGYGYANHSGYSNPGVDRLIEQSNRTLDHKERIGILHMIQKAVMEDMPLIPLYIRNRAYGVSRQVNFTPRQDARVKLIEISWAK